MREGPALAAVFAAVILATTRRDSMIHYTELALQNALYEGTTFAVWRALIKFNIQAKQSKIQLLRSVRTIKSPHKGGLNG